MEIGLVSCTKQKRDSAAAPRDLYDTSPLFRKSRRYSEENHDRWYVLSAKHHLLDSDGPSIEPYDETLTSASTPVRREWSQKVKSQLSEQGLLSEDNTLIFHTGKAYYGELVPLLSDEAVGIEIPTEGLMLGETLSWYNERI